MGSSSGTPHAGGPIVKVNSYGGIPASELSSCQTSIVIESFSYGALNSKLKVPSGSETAVIVPRSVFSEKFSPLRHFYQRVVGLA